MRAWPTRRVAEEGELIEMIPKWHTGFNRDQGRSGEQGACENESIERADRQKNKGHQSTMVENSDSEIDGSSTLSLSRPLGLTRLSGRGPKSGVQEIIFTTTCCAEGKETVCCLAVPAELVTRRRVGRP